MKHAISRALDRGLDLRSIFDIIDQERKGFIDANGVYTAVAELGLDVDKESCKVIIKELNPDTDGKVSFNEFQSFARGLQSPRKFGKTEAPYGGSDRFRLNRFLRALGTVCVAQGLDLRDVFQASAELTADSFMAAMSPFDSTNLLASHVRYWSTFVPLLHGNPSERTIQAAKLIEALDSYQKLAPVATQTLRKTRRTARVQRPGHRSPTLYVPRTPHTPGHASEGETKDHFPSLADFMGRSEGTRETKHEAPSVSSVDPFSDEPSAVVVSEATQRKILELSHEQTETIMGRYRWLLHQAAKMYDVEIYSFFETMQPQTPAVAVELSTLKRQFRLLGIHFGQMEIGLFKRMFASANSDLLGYDSLKDFFLNLDITAREAGRRFGRVTTYNGTDKLPYVYDDESVAMQYWLYQKLFRDIQELEGTVAEQKLSLFVETQPETLLLDSLAAFMRREFRGTLDGPLNGEVKVINGPTLSAIEGAGGCDGVSKTLLQGLLYGEPFQTPLDAVDLDREDVSNLKLFALDMRMEDSWLEDIDEFDLETGAFPGVSCNREGNVISIDWYNGKLFGVPKAHLGRLLQMRCLRLNQNNLSGEWRLFVGLQLPNHVGFVRYFAGVFEGLAVLGAPGPF